jgi:mycofactocin system glycosyltransferase
VTPLPPGLRLVLDRTVRRGPGGTLIGGSPRRILRLSNDGWRALALLEQGVDAPAAARALGRRLVEAGMAHPCPAPREARDVTIVIPVRDRLAELGRCLGALDPATAVIVVDDGSSDPSAIATAVARHGNARLLRRPAPGGPAVARNAALAVANTELVAFLDSDCVAPRTWLPALSGHFDDPLVGAVAPRVRLAGRPRGLLGRYLAARSPLDMGAGAAGVQPGGAVSYVPTAALVVRRAALGDGFDAALRYGEDVDLVWRLRAAGWSVRYDPGVSVGHDEPATLRGLLARRFRYGTSAAPLAARHPGRLVPAVVPLWPALAALLLLTRRPGPAAVVAAQQSIAVSHRARGRGLPGAFGLWWFGETAGQTVLSVGRYAATFGLPVALATAVRRRRPTMLALLALPLLDEWRRSAPELDPVRWTALGLADDAAYGAGVWWGCVRARTVRPLLPRIIARRRAPEPRRQADLRR